MAISRLADGEILYANAAFYDALGVQRGEPGAERTVDLYKDLADRERLLALLESQGTVRAHLVPGISPGGEPLDALASFQRLEFQGQDAILGTFVDVTRMRSLERELARSQERFLLAQQAGKMGVWERDLETDEVTWSENVEALFGLQQGTFGGSYQAYLDAILPEDREHIEAEIKRGIAEGTGFCTEYRVVLPDGSVRWMQDAAYIFGAEGGEPGRLVGTVSDITDRKLAERQREEALEAVRQSAARHRTLFEAGSDAVVLVEEETLRIVGANSAAQELYGYSLDELLTMSPLDLSADPGGTVRSIREFADQAESPRTKARIMRLHRRKDGTTFPAEITASHFTADGRRINISAIRDITEREEAAERLRLLERALDAAGNGVLITDPAQPDNPIIYCNPAFERITGYARDEVLGRNCRFLQGEEREQPGARQISGAVQAARGVRAVVRNYRKDGALFHNELTITPVFNNQGELTHFVGILDDVTARLDAEAALQETREQMAQAEKLASLGLLVSAVAHEINNPNSVIMLSAPVLGEVMEAALPLLEARQLAEGEFLVGRMPWSQLGGRVPGMVQGIIKGSRRIRDFVGELRSLAGEAGNWSRQRVDLNHVAREASALAEAQVQRATGRFSLRLCDNLPLARANTLRLTQVVVSLLNNACEALDHRDQALILGTRPGPDVTTIELFVTDEGRGMEPEVLERALKPFFTTRRAEGGAGLGLSVARQIVEAYDGELTLESTPGQGTTARVILPLGEASVEISDVQ